MKILGVGLSRTGTKSLTRALEILEFTAIHNDRERLTPIILGVENNPDFRVYDDVDAVTDLPSAYFFRELLHHLFVALGVLEALLGLLGELRRRRFGLRRGVLGHSCELGEVHVHPYGCARRRPVKWAFGLYAVGGASVRRSAGEGALQQ